MRNITVKDLQNAGACYTAFNFVIIDCHGDINLAWKTSVRFDWMVWLITHFPQEEHMEKLIEIVKYISNHYAIGYGNTVKNIKRAKTMDAQTDNFMRFIFKAYHISLSPTEISNIIRKHIPVYCLQEEQNESTRLIEELGRTTREC